MADYFGSNQDDALSQRSLGLADWSTLNGLGGNDTLSGGNLQLVGGPGNDLLKGESFSTTALYWDSPIGIVVDLAAGTVHDGYGSIDKLENIAFIQGSGKGDIFKGNGLNNSFWSSSLKDIVDGGGGIDEVRISIASSAQVPQFTKTASGWLIQYKTDWGAQAFVETSSIELVSIYRGNLGFETWDLIGPEPRLVPKPGEIPQLVPYFIGDRQQWRISKWGIVAIVFEENTGEWYYPTRNASDYHPAANLSPDMHNAALGDFNGDGFQDIFINWVVFPHVIPHETRPLPTILWGSANGLIKAEPNAVPETAGRHQGYRTLIADLNGDGVDDIVAGAMPSPQWTDASKSALIYASEPTLAMLGSRSGVMRDISDQLAGQTLTKGALGSSFDHASAVGDLNNDGIDDIFSGNNLWVSDGASNWLDASSIVKSLLPVADPMSLAIGDLNGDGVNDILALFPDFANDRVVLLNDSSAKLGFKRIDLPAGLYGDNNKDNFALIADIDFDGLNDIVIAQTRASPYYIGSAIQLLMQKSPGIFVDETLARIDNAPRNLSQGEGNLFFLDVNGDGLKDLVHSSGGDGVAVFLNDEKGRFNFYPPSNLNPIRTIDLDGFQKIWYSVDTLPSFRAYPIDANRDGIMDWVAQVINPQISSDFNEDKALVLYVIESTGEEFGRDRSEFLKGTRYAEKIFGLKGNDRLEGSAGSDSLDGGDGIDTAIFEKARSAYKTEKLSQDGITIWKVTDLATGDVDELRHIEKLEFAKASVAGYQNLVQTEVNLDVTGTPAVTYRLYRAAFARDPDLGGLGYWVSELQQYLNPNLSPEQNPYLLDVAKTFVESKEFKDKYGADVDNATYIRNLYKNALGRDPLIPDPVTGKTDAGYTYWVGVLDAKAASRSDLFVYFSESTENKAAVEPIIATGVEYVPWPPLGV